MSRSKRAEEDPPDTSKLGEVEGFDRPFKVVDGKVNVSSREYNELNAQHGNAWNWCKAFGLRLVRAIQLDDGTVDVYVQDAAEFEAAQATGPTVKE